MKWLGLPFTPNDGLAADFVASAIAVCICSHHNGYGQH